jgi:hypothetical protein
VGRQCRAKEQGAGPAHAEPHARHHRRDQREHEGEAAERGDVARAPPHHVEVDLEPGEEHDVEQADRAEQFDHRLIGQDGATAGPQQHAEQQQPDDAREARMLEQELHGQRRGHHHRELNQHVLDRQPESHRPYACHAARPSARPAAMMRRWQGRSLELTTRSLVLSLGSVRWAGAADRSGGPLARLTGRRRPGCTCSSQGSDLSSGSLSRRVRWCGEPLARRRTRSRGRGAARGQGV